MDDAAEGEPAERVEVFEGEHAYPPFHFHDQADAFPDNFVKTSRYTMFNYIPYTLAEQFRKGTNVYFTVMMILSFIPEVSSLKAWTLALPLALVLAASILKNSWEDFKRYRADQQINNRVHTRLNRSGQRESIACQELTVGSIVLVSAGEEVPADIIVLSTSDPAERGLCFTNTAQLDGESSLKRRYAFSPTKSLSAEQIASLVQTRVYVGKPTMHLDEFNGAISVDGSRRTPVDESHLLLRGCLLQNTEWVVGVVAYTGPNTKIMLNSGLAPAKYSRINKFIDFTVLSIVGVQVVACIIAAALAVMFPWTDHAYLHVTDSRTMVGIKAFFLFLLLTSRIVPFTLTISLEIAKLAQGKFIDVDKDIVGAVARSTDQNDELGRVSWICSDKTGTLTKNVMRMKFMIVGGQSFEAVGSTIPYHLAHHYLLALALAHSATREGDEFKSSSPDEEALVAAAAANGVTFCGGAHGELVVNIERMGDVRFSLLHTISFTSKRAMMSVIVRDETGDIVVYSKGADSRIIPRLRRGTDRQLLNKCVELADGYAMSGLRTLVVVKRILDPSYYQHWAERLRLIETGEDGGDLNERKARSQNLFDEIETDFEFLGITCVEDELQDDVGSTIDFFLKANIRFIMITGDKQGTAINIARSTNLVAQEMTIVKMNAETELDTDTVLEYAEKKVANVSSSALVVDGTTIKYLLREDARCERFYRLMENSTSTVCCRANPKQKAALVALIRRYHSNAITLAIGDGGNDVSMLQKAHIGVGIRGREGTQAARTADYVLTEFQHLRKLVAVHGRWCYVRNSVMIQFTVYRNFAFVFVLLWYGSYSAWSGQLLYDSWVLTLFNTFFTFLPGVLFGIFERNLESDQLIHTPEAYHQVQSGDYFNSTTVAAWVIEGLYASLVFFYIPYFSVIGGGELLANGNSSGLFWLGNLCSISSITGVNLRLLLETQDVTWVTHVGYTLSFLSLIAVLLGENVAPALAPEQVGQMDQLLTSGKFWMVFLLTVSIALLPAVIWKSLAVMLKPSDAQLLSEQSKDCRDEAVRPQYYDNELSAYTFTIEKQY